MQKLNSRRKHVTRHLMVLETLRLKQMQSSFHVAQRHHRIARHAASACARSSLNIKTRETASAKMQQSRTHTAIGSINTTQLVGAHHHLDGVDFSSLGDVPKAHHALRIGRESVSKI
jgi:hypothetical protein